jgi:predicted nuclease of predicted toxin-antitoxin system
VNLLLDMNLPPSLTMTLRSAGFTAVHWSEIGDPRAADATVLDWARANGHVLVTHYLDFGALESRSARRGFGAALHCAGTAH